MALYFERTHKFVFKTNKNSTNIDFTENLLQLILQVYIQISGKLSSYGYNCKDSVFEIIQNFSKFHKIINSKLKNQFVYELCCFINTNDNIVYIDCKNSITLLSECKEEHLANNTLIKNLRHNWKSCDEGIKFFFHKILIYIFSTLLSEISFNYDFNDEMPKLLRLAHQIDSITDLEHVKCNINYNQKLVTYADKNFNIKILEEINSNINILTFPTFFHYTFVIDNLISKESLFSDFKKKLFSELSEILYTNVEYLEQKQSFFKAFDYTKNPIYLFELIYTPLVQIKC
ncbi:hypothetical protein COBT_001795, partial [Conglomerata obtusa]